MRKKSIKDRRARVSTTPPATTSDALGGSSAIHAISPLCSGVPARPASATVILLDCCCPSLCFRPSPARPLHTAHTTRAHTFACARLIRSPLAPLVAPPSVAPPIHFRSLLLLVGRSTIARSIRSLALSVRLLQCRSLVRSRCRPHAMPLLASLPARLLYRRSLSSADRSTTNRSTADHSSSSLATARSDLAHLRALPLAPPLHVSLPPLWRGLVVQ